MLLFLTTEGDHSLVDLIMSVYLTGTGCSYHTRFIEITVTILVVISGHMGQSWMSAVTLFLAND